MAGGGGGSTSSTKVELPEWLRPYAEDLAGRVSGLADAPRPQYSGQQIAGLDPAHQAGLGMIEQRANQGNNNPWLGATGSVAQDMLGGSSQFMSGQPTAQTQFGTAATSAGQQPVGLTNADNPYITVQSPAASNTYIGSQSQGIKDPNSVMGYAANQTLNNPWLGQQAAQSGGTSQVGAGQNSLLGMDNPYLNSAIGQAQGDVTRAYQNTVAPMRDAQARQSGSFGNTGVEQARQEDQRTLGNQLGQISTNMRMQDYGLQAQLGEGDASRQLAASTSNAGNLLANNQFNASLGSQDLSRNLAGAFTQGQWNTGQLLDAAKFDVNSGMNAGQFNATQNANDLARNAGMLQDLSKFNVGNQVNDVRQMQNLAQSQTQFNAGAANQLGMFNNTQAGANSQFNAGQQNAMSQFNAGQGNANSQFNTNLASNRQQQGLTLAQMLANQPYADAQQLLGVGDARRDYSQSLLNQAQSNWTGAQNAPNQSLDMISNMIRTMMGGGANSTTTNSGAQVNPLAQLFGAGTAGYGLGKMTGLL